MKDRRGNPLAIYALSLACLALVVGIVFVIVDITQSSRRTVSC